MWLCHTSLCSGVVILQLCTRCAAKHLRPTVVYASTYTPTPHPAVPSALHLQYYMLKEKKEKSYWLRS